MRTRALMLAGFLLALAGPSFSATLSADLKQQLETLPEGQSIPVILNFADRVDLSVYHGTRADAKSEILALRDRANRTQSRVLSFLRTNNSSVGVKSFWICNSIAVRCPASTV